MQVEHKAENKDNDHDNSYTDFELPDNAIPAVLLNINIEFSLLVNIMTTCAVNIDEFQSDHQNDTSQATVALYQQFANKFNNNAIDHVRMRQITNFLKQNDQMLQFWSNMANNISTFMNQTKNTVWLNPPIESCIVCENKLSLKNIRHTYAATNDGIVSVLEKIYRCQRANCNHRGKAVAYNYYRDAQGKKRYWSNAYGNGTHRRTVWSPYLNKYV